MSRRVRMLAPVAALVLVLGAGCGGADSATDADQQAGGSGAAKADAGTQTAADTAVKLDAGHAADHDAEHAENAVAASPLPSLDVVQVASGKTADLSSLAEAGKPTLLWFWAPHCTICRAEAPDVLAFAKEHGSTVQVLGLGAQDDLDQAEEFLADTGTEAIEMVWDAQGSMWRHYEVTNQPTVVVLDADGKVKRTWFRDFDEQGILDAAGVDA